MTEAIPPNIAFEGSLTTEEAGDFIRFILPERRNAFVQLALLGSMGRPKMVSAFRSMKPEEMLHTIESAEGLVTWLRATLDLAEAVSVRALVAGAEVTEMIPPLARCEAAR